MNEPVAWINKVTLQYLTELGYSAKVYQKRSDGDIPLYTHPHPDNLGLAESIIKQQELQIKALKADNQKAYAYIAKLANEMGKAQE